MYEFYNTRKTEQFNKYGVGISSDGLQFQKELLKLDSVNVMLLKTIKGS